MGRLAVAVVVLLVSVSVGEAKKKEKVCNKGWECSGSMYCCNETITDYFQVYQFENLFSKRNAPVAHAVGFWDYQSFITAAAVYEPLGFGTTGGKQMGMKEVAAFLGHVGSKTSCGYGVATGGPLSWGLCYNHEMSPSQSYCADNYKYPCTPGAEYYGRGALPVYWNYNYGLIGEALKIDLLNHPEYLEQNATMAFQSAIWRWMTPMKKKQPSAHDAFVGNWKPSKNDTLEKRYVAKTLAGTAVYTVSNSNNEFVLVSDPNNGLRSLGLLCFRHEDAEALLAQVQLRQPVLGKGARVVPITLDQVYMLKVEGIAFRFLPDPLQIKNALELKSADLSRGFDGVPVFQSDLLVVKKKNKRYCPIYFQKEDIERELSKVSRASRGSGISQHIMVGSLEDVLKKMEMNGKNSGWDDLVFIPPGKSHAQHISEVAA